MTKLTEDQLRALRKIWFVFGNHGKKSTHANHRFIQDLIQDGEDNREFYIEGLQNIKQKGHSEEIVKQSVLTDECINEVDKILNS